MKTYKVEIKNVGAKTHLLGCLVVMANNKGHALSLCANEIGTVESDFNEPVEYREGIVFCTDRSAWDGYR